MMRRRDDGGAAVVEFLMISVLLILLLFCALQLGVFFYARNIVSASAADAARFAGSYGVSPSVGGPRAAQPCHPSVLRGSPSCTVVLWHRIRSTPSSGGRWL